MKIEISCIDAMYLVYLAENMAVIDSDLDAFYQRIINALKEAGLRPLKYDEVLLPIKVENNV